MSLIVQKYGGSSLADLDKLRAVAGRVAQRREAGHDVVVVVSAMGKTTDELLAMANALSKQAPRRELDMLLSAGERISAALLALALAERAVPAQSLTGSQCGIITNDRHVDARIIEVRPVRIEDALAQGQVVIVAGFQGMSYRRDVTTLGRGGSDTTAVALAAALKAEACEIYSDVDGVLSADPRLVNAAQLLDSIGYPEMQELACAGAKVLNAEAVEFAKRAGIALYARRSGSGDAGTLVRVDPPPPSSGVRGIAHLQSLWVLRCPTNCRDEMLGLLAAQQVKANFIVQIGDTDLEIWLTRDNVHQFDALRGMSTQHCDPPPQWTEHGAVSLIGEGVLDDTQHLATAIAELKTAQIVVQGIATSSFRITLLVAPTQVAAAVQTLHAHFVEVALPGQSVASGAAASR